MQLKKVFALVLALVLALSLLAGCSTGETAEAPAAESTAPAASEAADMEEEASDGALTIAFSQTGNQNNWKVTQTNDMKEKIEGAGHTYIYTDAQDDTAKQISDLEDIISQNPDYIILSPREDEGLQPALEEAKAAGIPVILVDRGMNAEGGEDYLTLTCGDFVWEGEETAAYMLEQFNGERCNVVELTGTPGASVSADRQEGFLNGIEGHDNVEIIASQVGNFSRSESQEVMENLIQSYGDEIDAVYAHNDDNAIGAIQAIKAAGLVPGEDIMVYGIDGQKDALQAIIDGELESSVQCSPMFGETVLQIIDMYESGEDIDAYIKNPGKLYTIDNAEASMGEAY